MSFHVPEVCRRREAGQWSSSDLDGNNGMFDVPCVRTGRLLKVIASDGGGWEHVSVSLQNRCPNWTEMCHVKALFWDAEDCVIQYHPPESQYRNCHPHVLHLWRPVGKDIPMPDPDMVGPA